MLFGVALGMTLAILYQYINQSVDLTIMNLYYPIIVITLIGIILRIITIFIWKNKNYNINSLHSSRPTK